MPKKIQGLVLQSYKNDELDSEIIDLVASRLNRRELKQYIRLLKQQEHKKHVYVTIPSTLTSEQREMIQKLFFDKKILYTVDPAIISGIRIIDNDIEYEISLDQIFHDLITHLTKYD